MSQSTYIFLIIMVIVYGRYQIPKKFLGKLNENSVIGIFTQPSDYAAYPEQSYSYLAACYVKFMESSGARVVPIPYEADDATLERYFLRINGFVIPGGTVELDLPTGPSKFTRSVAYMLQRAIQVNNQGEVFPVFGICLGHQTLHYIVSGYRTPFLIKVYDEMAINHAIESTVREAMFYKDLSEQQYTDLTTKDLMYYNHNWGVSPSLYTKYPSLDSFFEITGLNKDSHGQVFIASTEAKQYPILTVQYHAEKANFEWKVPANHSMEAITITQNHGDVFVELSRNNFHKFDNDAQLKNALIYNYQAIQEPTASFVQIYIFKLGELVL